MRANLNWQLLAIFAIFVVSSYSKSIEIKVVQTAQQPRDLLAVKKPIYFTESKGQNVTVPIKIDTSKRYQEIIGFGGAFTEASSYVYSQMNEANKKIIRDAYFGNIDETKGEVVGIGYTIGRFPINSCDFSPESYNFDNVTGDYELKHFNISHNFKTMIPFVLDCMKTSATPIRIFGTPWSPPAWMKSNDNMLGSNTPGLIQKPDIQTAWALYYSKFITEHEKAGIPIWGLTVQNEPLFPAPWEACVYLAETQRDFVKNYLGPRLRRDHPEVKLMIYDHNKDEVYNYAHTILSDPAAAQYVWGTAFHWYSGAQFENVQKTHDAYPQKFLMATEACNCPGVQSWDWSRGENYGYDVIGDLNAWANGWVDWNLLLDPQGGPNHLHNYCDAGLIGDAVNQKVSFGVGYYYMGQFSRYILPGSQRIGVETNSDTVFVTGFLTPMEDVVIVAMNRNDTAVNLALVDGGLAAEYTLLPHSIVTFIYPSF